MPHQVKDTTLLCSEIYVFLDCAGVNFPTSESTNLATLQIVDKLKTFHVLNLKGVFHNDDVDFAHALAINRKNSNNLYNQTLWILFKVLYVVWKNYKQRIQL